MVVATIERNTFTRRTPRRDTGTRNPTGLAQTLIRTQHAYAHVVLVAHADALPTGTNEYDAHGPGRDT